MTSPTSNARNDGEFVTPLRVLDLFSGIGGFSLGLERTGGFETVAFCEIDPFCRRVLAKHWPHVRQFEDVTKLKGEDVGPVDVICGGFPCQDISLSGKGAGLDGERSGLWREFARLIGELRPDYVLVENVAALLGRGLGDVLGDLAALGYDAEWHCIPASYAGARQLRDRVWIMAHAASVQLQGWPAIAAAWGQQSRAEQLAGLVQPCAWPTISSVADHGTGHGVPDGIHRLRALGNSVVPQIPELLGRSLLQARAA
jgi:DNA (cytosine-5)-methyltransferase 1